MNKKHDYFSSDDISKEELRRLASIDCGPTLFYVKIQVICEMNDRKIKFGPFFLYRVKEVVSDLLTYKVAFDDLIRLYDETKKPKTFRDLVTRIALTICREIGEDEDL